jgi:hypothetical protein
MRFTPNRVRLATMTALLAGGLGTTAATVSAQGLDHFLCYRARTTSGAVKFVPRSVDLADGVHDGSAEVTKPRFLCAPADKNGENPSAPTHPLHLEDYLIKPATSFTPVVNQRVEDQFGTLFVDLKKPSGLQVPTAKDLVNPPAAEPAAAIDHFQCYKIKTTKGTPKFVRQTVTVEDQFGAMTVQLRKPTRLCLPVDKNGEAPGAGSHDARLLCYQAVQTSRPKFAPIPSIYTRNQFGFERLKASKPAELCVPAVQPPPNCGNDVIDPGEDCDGSAPSSCTGDCRPTCVCALCGDGQINQPNEECDGAAAPTCPGMCQPNCGCVGVCDPLDPSLCLHPFPNDYFTRLDPTTDTGRRVSLSVLAMPRNAAQVPINPIDHNRSDGFSPGNSIELRVPNVDLVVTDAPLITDMARSLDADSPTVIVNASTLAHHLHWAELDANAMTEPARALFMRPGINFDDGERYIVALRNMKRTDGSLIQPSPTFLAYRDNIPTNDPGVEARRPHMEAIFATLAAAGVPRSDLYIAWDFTVASTRNLTERMLFLRDDGFSRLGAAAPTFAVTQVTNEVDSNIFRTVSGTFSVERYVSSTTTGARFVLDANGLPIRQPTPQPASFVCHIPRAALANAMATAVPARGSIYGHGLLGSRTEVGAGNVRAMSNEHNFVFCATDWMGMASDDIPTAIATLGELSNFPAITDRLQQGFLNQLFLARLMIHAQGFASHAAFKDAMGNPVIDTSDVFYDGNSQGGIFGASVMAIAQDITRGVLGVPGMNYSTLLQRSTDFALYAMFLYPAYPNELERPLIFSLIQMLWDRSDPNGYASHITGTRAPLLPNTPAKKVLLHEAFGDFQVANVTTEIETRTLGAHIYQPALAPGRHTDVTPFFGIPAIPSFPFDGSALVVWDSGTPAPPTTNTPPGPGSDPHSKPRSNVNARIQKSEFLKTNGAVVDVCGGAPCLAP